MRRPMKLFIVAIIGSSALLVMFSFRGSISGSSNTQSFKKAFDSPQRAIPPPPRSDISKPVAEVPRPAKPVQAVQASRPSGPIKGTYPEWFSSAWSRSRTWGLPHTLVGDQPLHSSCKKSSRHPLKDRTRFIDPMPYLPQSKNPCWYKDPIRQTGFHCVPYFYIAGVAKCGTTDMYQRLRLHPEIMTGTHKEYHFWDRGRFGNVEIGVDGRVLEVKRDPWTFKEYTEKITGKDQLSEVEQEIKNQGSSIKIFGDASPSYLWDVHNWPLLEGNENCREPRFVIGQHIYHINPKAKIILIFRHPTPRLYSRFLSRIPRTPFLKKATSKDFHNYVKRGVQMYRACFKKWSIRACAYNATLFQDAVVRLVEGMYPVFMADWLRIWPRDQMLILRSEDYGRNRSQTLQSIFDFLGTGKLSGEIYEEVMKKEQSNVGDMYEKVGPMKEETIRILDQLYQPFVDKFAEILQDRRFLWKDTYTPKLE